MLRSHLPSAHPSWDGDMKPDKWPTAASSLLWLQSSAKVPGGDLQLCALARNSSHFHLQRTVVSALPAVWSTTLWPAQASKAGLWEHASVCVPPGARASTTRIGLNSQVTPGTAAVTADYPVAFFLG